MKTVGEQRPVSFHADSAFDTSLTDGQVPLSEVVMEMEVENCIICDAPPLEGGELINVRIENGVLRGDNICIRCNDSEELASFLEEIS